MKNSNETEYYYFRVGDEAWSPLKIKFKNLHESWPGGASCDEIFVVAKIVVSKKAAAWFFLNRKKIEILRDTGSKKWDMSGNILRLKRCFRTIRFMALLERKERVDKKRQFKSNRFLRRMSFEHLLINNEIKKNENGQD